MRMGRRGGRGARSRHGVVLVGFVVLLACSPGDGSTASQPGADTTEPVVDASTTVAETTSEPGTSTTPPEPSFVDPATAPAAGSACDTSLDATTDPELGARVTVWHGLGGEQALEAFAELVTRFEADHPNIDIVDVRVTGYADALDRLRVVLPDEFPELFMGSIDTARLLAESGVFVPPSACWGLDPDVLDGLLPAIRAAVTVDDVVWSYPFNISTPVLVYDRTMFAAVGLDPDSPPATPDEVRDAVETIVAAGAATGGLAMYDRSASWLVEQWAVDRSGVLAPPDNGISGGDVDGFDFASDDAVAALDWARRMYVDGLLDWRGTNVSSFDDLLALIDLDQGRTAITLHTSAALGDIAWLVYEAGIDGIDDAELGVGPLPTPDGRGGALVGGGSLWLFDHGDPVATGAAARFAEFLMSPSSQGTFAAATGYVPISAAAAASEQLTGRWAEFPQFAVPYRQVAAQTVTPASVGMQIGPRAEVQRVLEIAAADVILGGSDARDRLERAEQEAAEIVRLYR